MSKRSVMGCLLVVMFSLSALWCSAARAEEVAPGMDAATVQEAALGQEEAREILWAYLIDMANQGDNTAAFLVLNHIWDLADAGDPDAQQLVRWIILKATQGGDKWIPYFFYVRGLVKKAEAGDTAAQQKLFNLMLYGASRGGKVAGQIVGFILSEQARKGNPEAQEICLALLIKAVARGNKTAGFILTYGLLVQAREGNEEAAELFAYIMFHAAQYDDGRVAQFIVAATLLDKSREGDKQAQIIFMLGLAKAAEAGDKVAEQTLFNIIIRLARGDDPFAVFDDAKEEVGVEGGVPTEVEGVAEADIDEEADSPVEGF